MSKMPEIFNSKYKFLEKHREDITSKYQNEYYSIRDLSKEYGVAWSAINYRLRKWGVFIQQRDTKIVALLKFFGKDILLDHSSGMTSRYLGWKYGISHSSILDFVPKGKISRREPRGEELERLLEDIKSELFFLDELIHCYTLPEKSILEVAYNHKCRIHFGYDDILDFLMFSEDLTINQILFREKGLILK